MPSLDDDERAALAELLADTIAADRLPRSPRIRCLKAILDKLDVPKEMPGPYPPLKARASREHGAAPEAA